MDLIWVRVVLYCPSNSDPEAISFNESILCACLELDRRFRRLQKWWEPKVSTIWNFSSNSWYWGTNPINLKIHTVSQITLWQFLLSAVSRLASALTRWRSTTSEGPCTEVILLWNLLGRERLPHDLSSSMRSKPHFGVLLMESQFTLLGWKAE